MIKILSVVAAACAAVASVSVSAQTLPDVLRPDGETKHLAVDRSHDIHAHAIVDRPTAVQRRNYDVLSYDLFMDWRNPLTSTEVTGAARVYSGMNRIRMHIDSAGVSVLRLNANQMTIDSVHCTPARALQLAQPVAEEWSVSADTPFDVGDTVTLDVYYTSQTAFNNGFFLYEKGLETGLLPNGDVAIVEERLAYTMSEPSDARSWMPCNDMPYDKAMTSIAVRVPKPYTVASNGLLQEVRDEQDGSQTYQWKSSSPMPTYLMVAVASVYKEFSDWYHRRSNPNDSIPVLYYVWQKDYDGQALDQSEYNARHGFRNTVRMMENFSDRYVEYPFEKYGMAALQPFDYGGMEHQTLSTVHRRWIRVFDDPGIAHELMHQWTGDLVTCASFADIWLNEGGATYGEALWAEAERGKNGYRATLLDKRGSYLGSANNQSPIYAPTNIFNYATTYAKAGWVYHMLRRMLGDELYFATMKKYFTEFAYRSIETEDMVAFFEREVPDSPVPFRTFFDQWIYSARHPVYDVAYSTYPEEAEGFPVRVVVRQTQSGVAVPDVFVMPLTVTLYGANDSLDVRFLNNSRSQELLLHAPFPVVGVGVNDNLDVLAQVEQIISGVNDRSSDAVDIALTPSPVVRGGDVNLAIGVRQPGRVEVIMLDAMGRSVDVLYSGALQPGSYRLAKALPDVASGMYFLRIAKDGKTDMVKFIVTE